MRTRPARPTKRRAERGPWFPSIPYVVHARTLVPCLRLDSVRAKPKYTARGGRESSFYMGVARAAGFRV